MIDGKTLRVALKWVAPPVLVAVAVFIGLSIAVRGEHPEDPQSVAVEARSAWRELALTDGIQIGDVVPNSVWNQRLKIYSHPERSETVALNGYSEKLLILDFWATWCSPCLAAFPKIKALEDEFQGRVRFLPVSYQSRDEISELFFRLEETTKITIDIPTIVEDKILHTVFPHRELPHYVWIDSGGTVRAITGPEGITGENIEKVLQAKNLEMEMKMDDPEIAYDWKKPLFLEGNGGKGVGVTYHSVFAGYTEGLRALWHITEADDVRGRRIVITNSPISKLYRIAFGDDRRYLGANRLELNVSDPSRLTTARSGEPYRRWQSEGNAYSYELIVPPHLNDDIFAIMREDLRRVFPQYEARMEKRRRMCYVLVRTSAEDKLRSEGGERNWESSPLGVTLRNIPLYEFARALNVVYMQRSPYPVIDETDYEGKVDMEVRANMSDAQSINKELEKYDLKIMLAEREIDVLVIVDQVQT